MKKQIKKQLLAVFLSSVIAIQAGLCPAAAKPKDYSKYSTAKHGWGLAKNSVHKVPGNGDGETLKKHGACYYVPTKEKTIYLTFDCGYENGNTKTILNTLKKYDIKALFFVTKPYIAERPKLVKRMKKEGHLVGNHTVSHPSLPTCSVKKIRSEILDCAAYMKEATGYEMDKFVRPPMGEWSVQSLEVTKDLGYQTVLWSMAFYDYDVNNQPGKDAIISQFMQNYHKGAIPLLHGISTSDTEALPAIIKRLQKKGYSFGLLTDL